MADPFQKYFPRGGFLRSAAGLAAASVLAQAIGMVSAPALTRLFGPAEVGALALFSASAALIGIVAGGRFHLAFAPAPPADRAALLGLTMLVAATLAVVLTVLAFPLGPWLARGSGTGRAFWVWLAPSGAALMALNVALRWLAVAEGRPAQAARALVLRPAAAASCQIMLGLLGADEAGLIFGALSGWLAADLLLLAPVLAGRRFTLDPGAIVGAARRWQKYPAQSLPGALAAYAVTSLPEFYIAARHGAHAVGQYAMVVRLLAAPAVALSEAVSALWWRRAAAEGRSGPALLRLLDRLLLGLAVPATATGLLMIAFGPKLFGAALGPEWAAAGAMAQVLAPYHAMRMVSAPALQTGAALERLLPASLWHAADLALALVACLAGFVFDLKLATWLALLGGLGAASRGLAVLLMRAQAAGRV